MILPSLFIAAMEGRGRGVFAGESLTKGTTIELSPVIVMDEKDKELLDRTRLHDYIFHWGDDERLCCMALGYLSLYNHDRQANCDYEMDFDEALIRITTLRDIQKGEELCINYNGSWNDQRPVWFEKGGPGEV